MSELSTGSPQDSTLEWSAKQRQYMVVLADPTEERTDEEIANFLSVDRKTLWNWRQLPGFMEESDAMLDKEIRSQFFRVVRGVAKRAERGDVQAARLYSEWANKVGNKSPAIDNRKIIFNNFEGLDDRELEKIIETATTSGNPSGS